GGAGVWMQHPLNDRAVASGRLAPDPAARNAVLRFDEGHELLPQVVVVSARRTRVDVLVPSHPGEAVDEGDDHGPHLPGSDEAVELRLQVLAERIDAQEHLAGPGVSDDSIRRRIAFGRIVSGR